MQERLLTYLIQTEDKYEAELIGAKVDSEHRSRVFAADTPNAWRMYSKLFPPEGSIEHELGGPIEEFVPESEADVQKLKNELVKAGIEFAD